MSSAIIYYIEEEEEEENIYSAFKLTKCGAISLVFLQK
jgi:hypothetical protein